MKVCPFDSFSDLPAINQWLKAHGKAPARHRDFPMMGFVALKEGEPIAAGFLRVAEGRMGIIDSLVTNPKADSLSRHEAIEALVDTLIDAAKVNGIDRLLAFSVNAQTLERAERRGFERIPHVVMSRQLTS